MVFTLLAFSLGVLLIPLIFHLEHKIFTDGNLKSGILVSLFSTVLLSMVGLMFVHFQVINFQTQQTIGVFLLQLPLEQYILNFSVSLASIGLYLYLNLKFPTNTLQRYSLAVSNLLLGLCIAFLFFGYAKIYTLVTFSTLFVLLFVIEYLGKIRFMYRAYRVFAVILVPLFVIFAVSINQGIMVVDDAETFGVKLVGVPVEHFFATLFASLLSIYLFEMLKAKNKI